MSFQERRSLVNLISSVLITVIYAAYVLPRMPEADPYSKELFHFWGSFFLLLIPVSIVARIIVFIIFYIINTIATREEEPSITDERDKLIELRANRNGFFAFVLGFVIAMASLVMEMPPSTMFIILICSGIASEVISDASEFVYYRRGF